MQVYVPPATRFRGLLWQVHQAVKKSTKQVDEGGKEDQGKGERDKERAGTEKRERGVEWDYDKYEP